MHLNSIHLIPAYHDVENHVYDEEEEDDQQEGDGSNIEEREKGRVADKSGTASLSFSRINSKWDHSRTELWKV